jgi:cyclopropane fatty-acyl-phospholipid synthase-like methyltransferase
MSIDERPTLDPHPLSPYVAWAGKRNRDPILDVFRKKFPKQEGHVLELATGSGMHINYFAPHFPHLTFHPSDMNEHALENVMRVTWENEVHNVAKPIKLDLTQEDTWPQPEEQLYDAIFVINIFQVAPISVADGMMKCASELLHKDGFLFIYGPFKDHGNYTTESNEEFDKMIHTAKVEEWGLKDIADLEKAAHHHAMTLSEKISMPANNFGLIFSRA